MRWYWYVIIALGIGLGGAVLGVGGYLYIVARDVFRRLG